MGFPSSPATVTPSPFFAALQVGPLLGLAPMAGIGDWPMRLLCYQMGAQYACSEMVSAMGYMCAKPQSRVYQQLLQVHPQEVNTAVQLFGRDPVVMGEAAARLTELGRFASVDINMGCPARKVTSSGEGAALLTNPALAYKLMAAVKRNTTLPVTIKTRLGYDEDSMNAAQLVEAAADLGLSWACIHGRTRRQMYAGQADYAAIGAIRQGARIPIIANGDVRTGGDAQRILAETGAHGLMIGRGVMGNPWLFRDAALALADPGFQPSPVSLEERLQTALYHAELMVGFKGEAHGMVEMRKHVGHYVSGLHGAAALRRALTQVETLAELRALLAQLMETTHPKEDL